MRKLLLSLLPFFAIILVFAGCDANSTTQVEKPVTATRYADKCLTLSSGTKPIAISNDCDFNVIFRELPEEDPIVIITKQSAEYTPKMDDFLYGACQAPFTPVARDGEKYDCR